MRKREMSVALRESRSTAGPKKFGPDLLMPVQAIGASGQPAVVGRATFQDSPFPGKTIADLASSEPSDVEGKYALLLKYSDKARAAEARLTALPNELRERFKQEAVADPSRIEEIATILVVENQKRLSPLGHPGLDALYRKLESHGPEAQAEFQQVVVLLKGQVDPGEVFAQIVQEYRSREVDSEDRPTANRDSISTPPKVETAHDIEKRRNRAARIAREIVELRHAVEGRFPSARVGASKEAEYISRRRSAANSNHPGKPGQPAAGSGHRSITKPSRPASVVVATSAVSRNAPREQTKAATGLAMLQGRESSALADNPAVRQKWVPSLMVIAVMLAASGGAWKLMAPSPGASNMAHHSAVAEPQQQSAPQETALREAANAAAIESASLKAAEETVVAEAATRRHEEEVQQARFDQEKAAIESARQIAEAERRAAAEEVARREAAEEAHRAAQASAGGATESKPTTEAAARQQAEKTEAALNLSDRDRKHVQASLTAVGHDVPTTGYFGPVTRSMITAWQKAQGLPATGFLDQPQLAALYAQATPAGDRAEQAKLDAQRAEVALNLSDRDRKRVQAALTALGHEVPTTGFFGPVTRTMIAAWQKTQGLPVTGHLTRGQLESLQQQAADISAKPDRSGLSH